MYSGFSKKSIEEKIAVLKNDAQLNSQQIEIIKKFQSNGDFQFIIENISENYISEYHLPYSIAPNFKINNTDYIVPMVTEESSVVAAASYAAKFWNHHGGFTCKVIDTKKRGQVYFNWNGNYEQLLSNSDRLKSELITASKPATSNMDKRGGGILDITLEYYQQENYFILNVDFETVDSMGANFINSTLELMAAELELLLKKRFPGISSEVDVIMSILSNYTPECIAECIIQCEINRFSPISGKLTSGQFASKFEKAVYIAKDNISRAVTHNKGIFNGIDAVLLATGNDFRAVEACGHAYASRNGMYTTLTDIEIDKNIFTYKLKMPLSLGTVGGLTSVHPLAKLSLNILRNPGAKDLMQIVASVGLASNFSAIRSLITDGIQKGHMKLHLSNIIEQLNTSSIEKDEIQNYFKDKQVSYQAVSNYLNQIRVHS